MTPAGSDPKRQKWRQRIRDLLARILTSERFKILAAVWQVAALIAQTLRSCS